MNIHEGRVSKGASLLEKVALIGGAEHSMREDRQNQWKQEGGVLCGRFRNMCPLSVKMNVSNCCLLRTDDGWQLGGPAENTEKTGCF